MIFHYIPSSPFVPPDNTPLNAQYTIYTQSRILHSRSCSDNRISDNEHKIHFITVSVPIMLVVSCNISPFMNNNNNFYHHSYTSNISRKKRSNLYEKQSPPAQFDSAQFEDAEEEEEAAFILRKQNQTIYHASMNLAPIGYRADVHDSYVNVSERLPSCEQSMVYEAKQQCSISLKNNLIKPEDRNDNDVLLGRGKGSNNYGGNRKFRAIVAKFQHKYQSAKRKEKPLIAKDVANVIRCQNPPGRFLQLDKSTECWYEVSIDEAIRKCSQALREGRLQRNSNANKSSPQKSIKRSIDEIQGPLVQRSNSIGSNSIASGPLKKRLYYKSEEDSRASNQSSIVRKALYVV